MSLFDKLRGRRAAESAPVDPNPYLNARRQWNEHVGGIAASRRLWQTMAILSMLIVLAAVGGVDGSGRQRRRRRRRVVVGAAQRIAFGEIGGANDFLEPFGKIGGAGNVESVFHASRSSVRARAPQPACHMLNT